VLTLVGLRKQYIEREVNNIIPADVDVDENLLALLRGKGSNIVISRI